MPPGSLKGLVSQLLVHVPMCTWPSSASPSPWATYARGSTWSGRGSEAGPSPGLSAALPQVLAALPSRTPGQHSDRQEEIAR